MKQRLISSFLILTLIASTFVGAMSVSVRSANAVPDSFTSDALYWDDFKAYIRSIAGTNQINTVNSIFTYADEHWNSSNFQIFVIVDDAGDVGMLTCEYGQNSDKNGWFLKNWSNPEEYKIWTLNWNATNAYIKFKGFITVVDGGISQLVNVSQTDTPVSRSSRITISGHTNMRTFYPSPFEWTTSTYKVYALRSITGFTSSFCNFSANIYSGSYVPPVVPFEWKKFNVGERWYVTTVDQSYMYGLFSDGDSPAHFYRILTNLKVHFLVDDSYENFEMMLTPDNITELPDYFVTGLTNVSNNHIYAFEITDFVLSPTAPLYSLFNSGIYYLSEDYQGDITDAQQVAENSEFVVQLTPDQENISYNEAMEQFHEYSENYNETHVIPEQLGEWLFNAEGSKLLPCTVQLPGSFNPNDFNLAKTTFAWSIYPQDNSGYNYDILDTVIIPANVLQTSYNIRYWYDDLLDPKYAAVDLISLTNLFLMFDVVIICPDSFFEGLGVYGYTGSSGQGVKYSSEALQWNTIQGFAILTQRAIQKQQLYNFNDGFTKLYQLEVDYINSEDAWKDSFLLWTASLYSQVDSLWGKLNEISIIMKSWTFAEWFGDISAKLGQLVENTSETEVQPWYLSLWNWVSQFNPSDNDFSASLEQYDNNWEDFPELPGPSTVPLLPTIGG